MPSHQPRSAESDHEADDELPVALRASRKAAKGAGGKRLAALQSPLPVQGARSEEERLKACLALLEKLPKQSAWARHRRRVLEKALELLRVKRTQRTAQEAQELASVLSQLGL